jgi:hypothetical protein
MNKITERGGLRLTQQDLDRGLTDEQLDWIRDHLNMQALVDALVNQATKKGTDNASEDATRIVARSTGGGMDAG